MFGQTAPVIHTLTYAAIPGNQLVLIGASLLTLIFATPLALAIGSAWSGVVKLRLKAGLKQQVIALKQQMVERGMTADEIIRVLGPSLEAPDALTEEGDGKAGGASHPCASEVIVEREGEWQPALVLGRSGDRCLIHTCAGYGYADMSDNEWVDAGRVRFPASSDGTGAFGADPWGGKPKEPVPAEV
jgi:hypothetical protein